MIDKHEWKFESTALDDGVINGLNSTTVTVIVSVSVLIFILTAYLIYCCIQRCCFKFERLAITDGTDLSYLSTESATVPPQSPNPERSLNNTRPIDDKTTITNKTHHNVANKQPRAPSSPQKSSTGSPPTSPPLSSLLLPPARESSEVSSSFSNVSRKPPAKRIPKSSLVVESKLSNMLSAAMQRPMSEMKSRQSPTKSPTQPHKKRRRRERRIQSPNQQQRSYNISNPYEQKTKQQQPRDDHTSVVNFEAPITAEVIRQHIKEPLVREYSMFKSPSFFD